jgi:membrane protease YdiL (CAAX protease family)
MIILIAAKRRFEDYCLTNSFIGYNLEVGLNCLIVSMIPYGMAIALIWTLGISFLDWLTVVALSGGYVIALVIILSWLQRREASGTLTPDNAPPVLQNVIVVIILLLVPLFLGWFMGGLNTQLISLVIWQLVVSGFGEEVLWRGYIQSRLNEDFGHTFEFMGVKFGLGLIITSFLFGLAHALSPFNPFTQSYEIDVWYGVYTFFAGVLFGFIREKTNSIIALGLAHGLTDAVGEGISLVLGLALN